MTNFQERSPSRTVWKTILVRPLWNEEVHTKIHLGIDQVPFVNRTTTTFTSCDGKVGPTERRTEVLSDVGRRTDIWKGPLSVFWHREFEVKKHTKSLRQKESKSVSFTWEGDENLWPSEFHSVSTLKVLTKGHRIVQEVFTIKWLTRHLWGSFILFCLNCKIIWMYIYVSYTNDLLGVNDYYVLTIS